MPNAFIRNVSFSFSVLVSQIFQFSKLYAVWQMAVAVIYMYDRSLYYCMTDDDCTGMYLVDC